MKVKKKKKLSNTIPNWIEFENKKGWKILDYKTLSACIYLLPKGKRKPNTTDTFENDVWCVTIAGESPRKYGYKSDVFPIDQITQAKLYVVETIDHMRRPERIKQDYLDRCATVSRKQKEVMERLKNG